MLIASVLPGKPTGLAVANGVSLLGVHRLRLGEDVYLGPGTWINALGGVQIGSEVMTGPYVVVASTNHGFLSGSARRGGVHPEPVFVGEGSWVGAHAVLTAGSTIGAGTLVGANAVVSGAFPPNSVIGGVPARRLAERSDRPGAVTRRSDVDAS